MIISHEFGHAVRDDDPRRSKKPQWARSQNRKRCRKVVTQAPRPYGRRMNRWKANGT